MKTTLADSLDGPMLDVTFEPTDEHAVVELVTSPTGDRVWVNVNGICRFRACNVRELVDTPKDDLEEYDYLDLEP